MRTLTIHLAGKHATGELAGQLLNRLQSALTNHIRS